MDSSNTAPASTTAVTRARWIRSACKDNLHTYLGSQKEITVSFISEPEDVRDSANLPKRMLDPGQVCPSLAT
jgi:biotin synthase-related radical SAM superfamily protein